MLLALIAAASLVQSAAPIAPDAAPQPTARDLEAACARYIGDEAARSSSEAISASRNICWPQAMTMLFIAEGRRQGADDRTRFCLPADIRNREDPVLPLAQAYVEFFARLPAERHEAESQRALLAALIARWPCAR